MREALDKAVRSIPGAVIPNAIGVAGIFAGLFPEKIKERINGVNVDQARLLAILCVCIGLAYWVLRLVLRTPAKTGVLHPTVSAAGDRSVAVGGHAYAPIDTGDKHFHGKQPYVLTSFEIDRIASEAGRQVPVRLITVSDQSMGDDLEAGLIARGVAISGRKAVDSYGSTLSRASALFFEPMSHSVILDPTY